ncbi:hypothetical protein VA249_45730 (plasmid) [Vibrio alfacsensis]|uniref:DUF4400 domain-containing protein n=1 Tax=Vibrio alfacsensis TaxID=1074311 RepID=UPI001BF151D2|nr:DUF4400 domain-containing protein [Vibrio alfacsensis]BBM67927.1 hypothetical protein VA249_45730 [Vibrio alfacsensis]
MAKKKMDKGVWYTLVFTMLMPFLFIVSLFFPAFAESNMNIELQNLATFVGYDEAKRVYESISMVSDELLIDSGAVEWLRDFLLPTDYLSGTEIKDTKFFNTPFWTAVDNAIYGIVLNVDFALLRLWSLKIWLAAMIVFTGASALSGYWIREIKKHGFEYSSPMRHGIGRRIFYTLPIVGIFYVVAPIALPSFFVPIACLVYSFAVMTIVANTIKRV